MPRVAVVVPVYKDSFVPDEEHSLRHLRKYLGRYDCYQFSPKSLRLRLDGFRISQDDDKCFTDVSAYSRCLLSPPFYERFAEYDFILIYQLDCLVFRDELEQWCDRGFDYIGAPLPLSKSKTFSGFSRVGNGGFSLRRVSAFLEVLGRQADPFRKTPLLAKALLTRLPDLQALPARQRLMKTLSVLRQAKVGARKYAAKYSCNEDMFWSDRAQLFDANFKIAPLETALKFAFETWPRESLKITRGQLPFGCHAWAKYDRKFWESCLEPCSP